MINCSTTMSHTNLNSFLFNSKYDKESEQSITHTRIGDKAEIYGGSYTILPENVPTLHRLIVDDVIRKRKHEYLTEVQLEEGPIAIDLDFRYAPEVTTRQHTKEDIISIILMFADGLNEIFKFNHDDSFNLYIFEKPNVNTTSGKNETKDGIHIIIGIHCQTEIQKLVRAKALDYIKLGKLSISIPLTNTWDNIMDEGIANRSTNWQLYGCRKPHNEAYDLKYHYNLQYDSNDHEFSFDENDVSLFDMRKDYSNLSVQNRNNPKFPIQDNIQNLLKNGGHAPKKRTMKAKKAKISHVNLDVASLINHERLMSSMNDLLESLSATEYFIQEAHDYTMILPESYYGAGSYNAWFQLGCALKNTDNRLFLSWMLCSCQSTEFDYEEISRYYEIWQTQMTATNDGLTLRSIIYWARKNCSKEAFKTIHEKTIDYFIEKTIPKETDFDLAMVLHQMYKEKFVCVNTKFNIWYKFVNHRWIVADTSDLSLLISTEMAIIYQEKLKQSIKVFDGIEDVPDKGKDPKAIRVNAIAKIIAKLKSNSSKNSVMNEAKGIFKDDKFIQKLDSNTQYLGFNNGVYDFTENVFRNGKAEDYISLNTNIDYIPMGEDNSKIIVKKYNMETREQEVTMETALMEMDGFMEQLFPNEGLRKYMWQHMASCLLGTNKNQTFNIYLGGGSNGKSALVDLLSKCLGDYKGTVPITLITQKRPSIGAAVPELVKLKGRRLAVMQEPQKNEKINEGILKELTGGDAIQGRALYQDSVEFIPQFKLIVCTNSLFDITANDNGTWRRIRLCEFQSFFTETPVDDDPNLPYQFVKDKELDKNFDIWKYAFMAKLIEIAKVQKGNVEDCDVVMEKSNEYREKQDHFASFCKDCLVRAERNASGKPAKLNKTDVLHAFKQWYGIFRNGKPPAAQELYDYMNKTYTPMLPKGGWSKVYLAENREDECEEGGMVAD